MMNILESRCRLTSLGLGTQRVCEPEGQWSFLADSSSLIGTRSVLLPLISTLCCTSSLGMRPLLTWNSIPCSQSPPRQVQRAVQSLTASWTQVYLQLCYVPCAGVRIKECASPSHKVLFHSFKECFCYVTAESHEKRFYSCSWCSLVSLCKSGSSTCVLQGCWAAGDSALMRIL